MKEKLKQISRRYTFGEEIADSVSHLVFALILFFATPWLAIVAYEKSGDPIVIWSFIIFGFSNFAMFISSMFYHTAQFESKHRDVLNTLDHIFIYVAIAGTYTPLLITNIEGPMLWIALITQWGIVIFGVLYKSLVKNQSKIVSLVVYLVMGWMAILLVPQIWATQNYALMFWMLLGGMFYTVGTIFFAMHHIKWFHFVWHLFVGLGSMSFLIAIAFFAI